MTPPTSRAQRASVRTQRVVPRAAASRPRRRPAGADPRVGYLYAAAFTAAFSAVAYELLLATYATYLMGATIFQYTLVVSLMMASMGMGALVVHRLKVGIVDAFLAVELCLASIAVVALPTLYAVYATGFPPRIVLGTFVVALGGLVGMEIPLLSRFRKPAAPVSRVLFFDYLGGFLGGILFPVVLVPALGLFRVAALLAVLNAAVGLALVFPFRAELRRRFPVWAFTALVVLLFSIGALVTAEDVRIAMESRFFGIVQKP